MLAAEGTTRLLVTATTRGQVEADRDVKNFGTSCADPVSSLRTHFWNSTNVPTRLILTIQISLQQLSASATAILASVFNHSSFHLTRHIFPSLHSSSSSLGHLLTSSDLTTSKSLFWGLPWFSPFFGTQLFITLGKNLRGLPFTRHYQLLAYSSILSKPGVIYRCLSSLHLLLLLNIVTMDWTVRGLNPRRGSDIFILVHSRVYHVFFVGQSGRKVLLNIRPFYRQCWDLVGALPPLHLLPSYACHVVTLNFTVICGTFGMVTNIYTD